MMTPGPERVIRAGGNEFTVDIAQEDSKWVKEKDKWAHKGREEKIPARRRLQVGEEREVKKMDAGIPPVPHQKPTTHISQDLINGELSRDAAPCTNSPLNDFQSIPDSVFILRKWFDMSKHTEHNEEWQTFMRRAFYNLFTGSLFLNCNNLKKH